MRLGIDASNIRTGGGVTHLTELLHAARPQEHGFDEVLVWSSALTLERVEDRPWLRKAHEPFLDCTRVGSLYWQHYKLHHLARSARCDVLFVPGGSYGGRFRPFVTMCRNMLPFDRHEARRFGFSLPRWRYYALSRVQSSTFLRAQGVIFLSQYACRMVKDALRGQMTKTAIIPHGVNATFLHPPRDQMGIDIYSQSRLCRLLYVSTVNLYKHQWHVAEAVARLRKEGLRVQLDLVGPAYRPALTRLRHAMTTLDPDEAFIRYRGPVSHRELFTEYRAADAFVFASSCENLPNILLEAMASGLPIACSNRGPMPEILKGGGLYFDPEQPDEIAHCLRRLLSDPATRVKCANAAYDEAVHYSWSRCAHETFEFLSQVARSV